MRWTRLFALAGALLTLLLGAARPASAHGYLVRAIPENGALLERAPTRVQMWFSEDLEPAFSRIALRDAAGVTLAEGGVDAAQPGLLTLRVPPDLPDGTYIVVMRPAFASDGHAITETRVFSVGAAAGAAQAERTSQAVPLEVVWRALSLGGLALLLGTLTLYSWVLVPAWGNPRYRHGLLPPRVMRVLAALVWGALALAAFGSGLALLQQAMLLFDVGAWTALRGGLWEVVRSGTRFGQVWTVRALALLLVAALLGVAAAKHADWPWAVRAFWGAALWAAALASATFSAVAHAAGALVLPWAAVTSHALHVIAVGMWAGGVAALALVLPAALRPLADDPDAQRTVTLAAMRRFSRVAAGALAVVITSGIVNSLSLVLDARDVASPYGIALAAKTALVLPLVALGALHHAATHPARWAAWQRRVARLGVFRGALRAEGLVALGVIALAGLLAATPPPVPAFLEGGTPAPSAATTLPDGTTLQASLAPGGPGANTFDVQLVRDGAPVTLPDGAQVYVRAVQPAADVRGPWHRAEPGGDGLYVAVGGEVDVAGAWHTLVDVAWPGAPPQRAAFTFEVRAEASVVQTLPPGPQHIAAIALLGVAVVFWLWPLIWDVWARMALNAVSGVLVVGATGVTVAGIVLGGAMIQRLDADYGATLRPAPALVNTVLPDAASLARGAALYETVCAAWDADTRALSTLLARLPRTRDEELYAFTRDGWGGLPPCAPLPDDAPATRWDLVNAIRLREPR